MVEFISAYGTFLMDHKRWKQPMFWACQIKFSVLSKANIGPLVGLKTIVFHSFEHFSVTVWFLMSEVPLLFLSTFSSKRMKEWTIRRLRKKRVVEWSRRRSIETYARFISFLSWRRRRRQSPYFAFRGGTSLLFIQALRNNSVNILCFVESFLHSVDLKYGTAKTDMTSF